MGPVEDRFQEHLVEGESLRATTSGRLLEDGFDGRTVVGLTDRRLLCVTDAGAFIDVRYDHVCSVRSRQRTRVEYRSGDGPDRVLHLAGGVGALGVVLVAVGVVLSVGATVGATAVALATGTATLVAGITERSHTASVGDTGDTMLVGAGVLSAVGLVVVGLLSGVVSTPVYVLATVGVLSLVGYARRYRRDLAVDGWSVVRHSESAVRINTVDGTTVRIAIDPDTGFDRELSASIHRRDDVDVDTPIAGSPLH